MTDIIDAYSQSLGITFFILCNEGIVSDLDDFLDELPGFNKFVVNSEGQNALLVAARRGHFELFKYLLEEHHFDINSTDSAGRNSLHLACIFNHHLDIISYLVEQSPNFDLNHCDNRLNSAIHHSYYSPIPDQVIPYLVVKDFDFNQVNMNGHTLADIAREHGSEEIMYIVEIVNDYLERNNIDERQSSICDGHIAEISEDNDYDSEEEHIEFPISDDDSLDRRESPKDSPSVTPSNCLISNPIVSQHQI